MPVLMFEGQAYYGVLIFYPIRRKQIQLYSTLNPHYKPLSLSIYWNLCTFTAEELEIDNNVCMHQQT